MEMLAMVGMLLGIALVLCWLVLELSGKPVPPAFKMVALVAVVLLFVVCLLQMTGCQIARPTP